MMFDDWNTTDVACCTLYLLVNVIKRNHVTNWIIKIGSSRNYKSIQQRSLTESNIRVRGHHKNTVETVGAQKFDLLKDNWKKIKDEATR